MCCGVAQNTYHTLKDLRVVFGDQDATVLDTSDPESRRVFQYESPFGKSLCEGVSALAREVQADEELTALINRKFSIKCTTGYAINALVDISPDEPVEMIKKLMVGSEGTFGFVSRATYNTVEDYPYKASTFILYPSFQIIFNILIIPSLVGLMFTLVIFNFELIDKAVNTIKKALELISDGIL